MTQSTLPHFRRILLALLTFITVASTPVLAAETITLRIGRGWGEASVWEELIREFEAEHPNIKVELDEVGWNMEKVVAAHVAGQPYDVVYAVIEQAQAIVKQGLLRPLDPFLERDRNDPDVIDLLDDIHPNLWNALSFDGSYWYVPYDWNDMVIWYNQRMVAEAGLEPPSPDWTRDDFLTYARRLTRQVTDGPYADVYGYGDQGWSAFAVAPWFFTGGGRILNDAWIRSELNSPENIETVEFLQSLIWEHGVLVPPGAPGYSWLSGNVAMIPCGRWCLASVLQTGTADEWAVEFWPRHRERTTVIGIGGHGVSSTTQYPDEAWEFAKWTASRLVLGTLSKTIGWTSPVARTSILTSPEFSTAITNGSRFLEALDFVRTVPSPPQFQEMNAILSETLLAVARGEESPGNAVLEMHRRIDAILTGAE